MKKRNKQASQIDDVIKAFRKANREIELERNGGRWIAMNRPHKNKKKYDRKRDSKVDLESLSFSTVTSLLNVNLLIDYKLSLLACNTCQFFFYLCKKARHSIV